MNMSYVMFTDGGARGNPGPAAIGVIIKHNDKIVRELGIFLGEKTNNEAEYTALITGLETCKEIGVTDLTCKLDSELVVKQVNGEYKVKEARLKEMWAKVKKLQTSFKNIAFVHVLRNQNKEADALVNKTLDLS